MQERAAAASRFFQLSPGAEARVGTDVALTRARIATARCYAEHILNKALGLRDSIVDGVASATALAIDAF